MSTTPQERAPAAAPLLPATRVADTIAFSLWIPAAVAVALSLAVSRVLGATHDLRWATLAGAGAFVVYGIDRLRDVDRDRLTSPRRTRFIERNEGFLRFAAVLAAGVLGATLLTSPGAAILLCLAVGALGLLHRRLKHVAIAKSLYVSLAWTAIIVGLPSLELGRGPGFVLPTLLFATFTANLIASNVRDGEAQVGPRRALGVARALAIAAIGLALGLEPGRGALAWIPAAELVALLGFRPTEHYGHIAIDGALLAGALATLVTHGA